MSVLSKRIEALERRVKSLEAPQPVRVFLGETEEEFQTFLAEHPGEKVVRIITICGRKCTDDCPTKGGYSCRFTIEGTQEFREATA